MAFSTSTKKNFRTTSLVKGRWGILKMDQHLNLELKIQTLQKILFKRSKCLWDNNEKVQQGKGIQRHGGLLLTRQGYCWQKYYWIFEGVYLWNEDLSCAWRQDYWYLWSSNCTKDPGKGKTIVSRHPHEYMNKVWRKA